MHEVIEKEIVKHEERCLSAIDKIYVKRPSVGQVITMSLAIIAVCGVVVGFGFTSVNKDYELTSDIKILQKDVDETRAMTKNLSKIPKLEAGIDSLLKIAVKK